MFLIQLWDSEAASISCVHSFDLSLGYLSTFYQCAQCGVWEALSLIMCCSFFFFFFAGVKNMSLHHAESPDSHVVYCRLTKGKEVKTVTPGNVNEVPQYHSGNTGRIPKQQVWEIEQGTEEEEDKERKKHKGKKKKWEKEWDNRQWFYLLINLHCQNLPNSTKRVQRVVMCSCYNVYILNTEKDTCFAALLQIRLFVLNNGWWCWMLNLKIPSIF